MTLNNINTLKNQTQIIECTNNKILTIIEHDILVKTRYEVRKHINYCLWISIFNKIKIKID